MNTKPELTDEEIRSYMNFDDLLSRHKTAVKEQRSIKRFITALIALSVVSIVSLLTFIVNRQETDSTIDNPEQQPKVATQAPLTRADDSVSLDNKDSAVVHQTPEKVEKANDSNKPQSSHEHETVQGEKQTIEQGNNSQAVFLQAAPVDGYPALYEYFARELKYPTSRMKDSINGVVSVVFTIAKNGRPEKIEIEQSLGQEFDDEAIRVISNMPDWSPATYNGKPMASRISLPLTFQVRKIK